MDLQLKNKVVLLAAATDGLGLATAKQLLQEGACVAICGRDETRNRDAQNNLLQLAESDRVLVVQCDITNKSQLSGFVDATVKKFHRIDSVVTNAGGPPSGTFETLDIDAYEKGFQLNLISAVNVIKAALPYLKKSDAASILTITSSSAKAPIPNLFISNVIRPAVIGLTKSLSIEFAEYAIRVNSILPGWTKTERTVYLLQKRAEKFGISYEEAEAQVTKSLPMKRMGDPTEFANVAAFLISPAASYVNGVMMLVDGGGYSGLL